MIIDSHQHFWKYEPIKHEWIDDAMSVIRKDFMPSDLQKVYAENGIDGCIAVQADQTLEETDFLLDLADKNDFIKGIVGWVDLRAENIEEVLETYSKYPKLKGFRHVVQGEPDHNFLLRPDFLRGIAALEKYDFTYDILVFPHQLGAVLELVKRFPNQKFVIDHIAKPYIKAGFYDGWAALMFEIGKCDNVYCKLSGIVTEADYTTWTSEQITPYMKLVLVAFGWKRIMFGSDWPVCLVAGNYNKIKKIVTEFIADFSSTEQASIMGENAKIFYNIKN
ncbi:L-fuconolactonase [Lutibacter agarilyticus]|uniref:L-fuconolactonase n=1 Tax=Lutibacter agarilyticus TaxID=1109740 RepID=A0A238VB63_9FLAO|nr:amidohydrolase family protein [Lutibacter agarilyticus]SNR30779.1 L-fuconolactonase [Lutibacter agarilyticus]